MIKHFNSKLTLSGNILEVREYENTQFFNHTIAFPKNNNKKVKEPPEKVMKKNDNRAIKEVKGLIASNYNDSNTEAKFLTFTFKDNFDLRESKKKLQSFNRKLKNHYGYTVKYVGVPELQKNNKIHFHIIYFGLPYIKHSELKKLWTYGSLHIKKVESSESSFNNLTKYMLKDRIPGTDRYFTSQGNLKRPIEIRNDLIFNRIKHLLKDEYLSYKFERKDEYTGSCIIKSFNLDKFPPEQKKLIQSTLKDSN